MSLTHKMSLKYVYVLAMLAGSLITGFGADGQMIGVSPPFTGSGGGGSELGSSLILGFSTVSANDFNTDRWLNLLAYDIGLPAENDLSHVELAGPDEPSGPGREWHPLYHTSAAELADIMTLCLADQFGPPSLAKHSEGQLYDSSLLQARGAGMEDARYFAMPDLDAQFRPDSAMYEMVRGTTGEIYRSRNSGLPLSVIFSPSPVSAPEPCSAALFAALCAFQVAYILRRR